MSAQADDPLAPSVPRLQVRPLATADLPEIFRVQDLSYAPEYREPRAAILNKLSLFPAGALACIDRGRLCGYAFALPWHAGRVLPVGALVDHLPERPDVIWIHDMVVAPSHRGSGVATLLLAQIARLAAPLGLDRLSLVAVQGSEPFWRRMGFRDATRFEYVPGLPATLMERSALTNVPPAPDQTE